MKPSEAGDMSKLTAKLFMGQVNQEQSKMLIDQFMPFSVSAVRKAITDHRASPNLKDGFWNMGQLLEGCRAAERGATMQAKQFIPDQTFAGIYRNDPRRPDLKDKNDFEVIIRVHRGWWNERNATALNLDSLKNQIESSMRGALRAAGMNGTEGYSPSRWVPYLYIPDEECQQWLDEVRKLRVPTKQRDADVQIPEFA